MNFLQKCVSLQNFNRITKTVSNICMSVSYLQMKVCLPTIFVILFLQETESVNKASPFDF